jgi:hypothetical protein
MLQLYVDARKNCVHSYCLIKLYVHFGLNSIECWVLLTDGELNMV